MRQASELQPPGEESAEQLGEPGDVREDGHLDAARLVPLLHTKRCPGASHETQRQIAGKERVRRRLHGLANEIDELHETVISIESIEEQLDGVPPLFYGTWRAAPESVVHHRIARSLKRF